MKRLFTAINIPEDIRDDLCDLRINSYDVNWTSWDNYHLTIKFLGEEINRYQEKEIISKLGKLHMPAFDLTLSSVGYFGSESNPRVLWAGVGEADKLKALNHQVVESLRGLELGMEEKKYKPHVTLGRPKRLRYEKVAEFLQSYSTFKSPSFHVDSFLLMRSELTRHGPVYTIEEEFELFES